MTPQELEKRIYAAIYDGIELGIDEGQAYLKYTDGAEDDIKQLLYDVIQAVTPEKTIAKPWNGEVGNNNGAWNSGHNAAIDTIQENTKNLLGEKR